MIKNYLENGKNYTLKYKNDWNSFDVFDVKVLSVTTESETAQFGVDSIFSEYFSKYNKTISQYVELMTISPEIYVCNEVKSRDPVEYEDTNMILIPKVIIDFTNSEEMLLCDKVTVNINNLVKYHELVYDRGEYLKNLLINVQKVLKRTEEFGDTPINLTHTITDILKTVNEYDKQENYRVQSFELEKLARDQEILKHNLDLKKMIQKSQELDTLISDYTAKIADLEDKISLYNEAKIKYDDVSDVVKTNGEILFSGLENSTITVNSVDYFTYRNAILTAVNGDIT